MSRTFDATDDVIDCASDASLDQLGPLTYSIWAKPGSAGENSLGRFFDKTNTIFFIRTAATPTTTLSITFQVTGASSLNRYSADNVVTTTGWSNYAVTWNGGTTASTSVKLYKNAIETSYNVNSNNLSSRTSDASSSQFIGNNSAGTRTFDGGLAYAQIFNRVLDSNELNQIMYFPGLITRGLVLFLPLWGSATEFDYSGKGNHGAVTGALVSSDNPPINGFFKKKKSRPTYEIFPYSTGGQAPVVVGDLGSYIFFG